MLRERTRFDVELEEEEEEVFESKHQASQSTNSTSSNYTSCHAISFLRALSDIRISGRSIQSKRLRDLPVGLTYIAENREIDQITVRTANKIIVEQHK